MADNDNSQEDQSARGKALSASTEKIMGQHLWLKILIGLILGVVVGITLSPDGLSPLPLKDVEFYGEWLALPGVVFLGLIQMIIIPLVVCSIIVGLTDSGSLEFVRKMGLRVVPYFLITTTISISIGLAWVYLIKPGMVVDFDTMQAAADSGAAANRIPGQTFENLTIPQRIANLIPTNLTQAQIDSNMLQIIIAAILVGIALLTMAEKTARPIKDLCVSGQILTMKIISWAMAIAPYAVFGLVSNITMRIGFDALASVGLYMITVLGGLFSMFLVYLVIIKLFSGIRVRDFIAGIREVQLLAFSTSSSGATMPFSIQAAEEKLDVRPEISRFIVPLGATINMDGTALYQAVAAIFLCQVYDIDLGTLEVLGLLATTVGASIGTPATPGVGIIVLATILVGIGVPAEGIALILGVDRILDMCRTTVNVTGDLTACAIMNRWVKVTEKVQATVKS